MLTLLGFQMTVQDHEEKDEAVNFTRQEVDPVFYHVVNGPWDILTV